MRSVGKAPKRCQARPQKAPRTSSANGISQTIETCLIWVFSTKCSSLRYSFYILTYQACCRNCVHFGCCITKYVFGYCCWPKKKVHYLLTLMGLARNSLCRIRIDTPKRWYKGKAICCLHDCRTTIVVWPWILVIGGVDRDLALLNLALQPHKHMCIHALLLSTCIYPKILPL